MAAGYRYTLDHTDVLVEETVDALEKKAAFFGFDLNFFKQFPWGVDLTHFSPFGTTDYRQSLGWRDKVVFLSNRSFQPLYGVDELVKAFASASKSTRICD